MEGSGKLHNYAFFGLGTRSICKGLVGLRFAKCTAPGLGLGGIWISRTHLANEILETGANVPIPHGGGFVEGYTPSDGVAAYQFLGYFTFCCQVKFGAYDNDGRRLKEGW